MSRSKEFGPNIFQRLEQGSCAREAMLQQAMALIRKPELSEIAVSLPVERSINRRHSGLLLAASAFGLAVGLNFVDGFGYAEASDCSTPTPKGAPVKTPCPDNATATPTATATKTPTAVQTAQGINIQIDNKVTFDQSLIDALRPNPVQSPRPQATPTLSAEDERIEAQRERARRLGKAEIAEEMRVDNDRTQQRIDDLKKPTPNATATWEAKATVGAQVIADRQATSTAEADPRTNAKARATALALQEEAARLEAENKEAEKRLRALKATPTPVATPDAGRERGDSDGGGFPWIPAIIATTVLGVVYLTRTRIPVVRRIGVHIPGPRI